MASLKQLLRTKEVVIGASTYEWLRPGLVKIYKQAGFDFIYLEYEHCLMNPTALDQQRKALALPGNIYMPPSDGYALSLELAEN